MVHPELDPEPVHECVYVTLEAKLKSRLRVHDFLRWRAAPSAYYVYRAPFKSIGANLWGVELIGDLGSSKLKS